MFTKHLPFVNTLNLGLTFVTTRDHGYTLGSLGAALAKRGVKSRVRSYDGLFRQKRLPKTTYILTDFDRLSPTELEIAIRVKDRLTQGGATVLNDPRHYRPRPQLMHHLRALGLNTLHAWEPAASQWPDRYPVLLRTIASHRGPLGDPIHSLPEAKSRVTQAMENGHPIADLTLIEYAADPIPGQGFRKYAAFRIGDQIIRANTVTDAHWVAKQGTVGLTSDAFYAGERAEMHAYPRAAHMRRLFNALGHDYGRIDYGLINDTPVIYEINSNPFIYAPRAHKNADRTVSLQILFDNITASLTEIAAPKSPITVDMTGIFEVPKRVWPRRPRRL